MAKASVGPGGRGVSYRAARKTTGRDLGSPDTSRSSNGTLRQARIVKNLSNQIEMGGSGVRSVSNPAQQII